MDIQVDVLDTVSIYLGTTRFDSPRYCFMRTKVGKLLRIKLACDLCRIFLRNYDYNSIKGHTNEPPWRHVAKPRSQLCISSVIAIGAMSAAVAVCDIKLQSREVMKESSTSTPIGCPAQQKLQAWSMRLPTRSP